MFQTLEDNHSFFEISDYVYEALSPISTFSKIEECVLNTDSAFSPNKITNCDLYVKQNISSTDYYSCVKCKWGMTGEISEIQTGLNGHSSCVNYDNECDVSTVYSGLSFDFYSITSGSNKPYMNYDNFVSCHKCINENKIPFYFMNSSFNFDMLDWKSTFRVKMSCKLEKAKRIKCLKSLV